MRSIEMRHSERVYNALPQLFNDVVQASNVVKRDWYLIWRHHLNSDSLLIWIENKFLLRWSVVVACFSYAFLLIPTGVVTYSIIVGEDGLQAAARSECLLSCFGFGAGIGIEAGQGLTDNVVEDRLQTQSMSVNAYRNSCRSQT